MKPKNDNPVAEIRAGWQWWLGAIIAIAAFVFGAVGLWRYEAGLGTHPDPFSIAYHTLQLFILHAPHLEHPAPWPLHVGRFLAAFIFFTAATKTLLRIFRNELLIWRLRLPRRKGHVIICGLGDLGLRLALDGRRRGKFVVAIEKADAHGAIERARAKGVLVLTGDARDPAQMRRANLNRAALLFAAGTDDQTNIAIATLSSRLAQADERRKAPLICRLLVNDAGLGALVRDESLFARTTNKYRINFNDLDSGAASVRQALSRFYLDFHPIGEDDDTLVHLIVIGFGPIGRNLVLQAARVGHFANEIGKHQRRLKITVVDKAPIEGWNAFCGRHQLSEVCDIDFIAQPWADKQFETLMESFGPAAGAKGKLVTYAVCIEGDDQTNLRVSIELSKIVADRRAQVLVHQVDGYGFTVLLPVSGNAAPRLSQVHAFGMKEDIYTWEVLLHEIEDQRAQAIHQDYQEKRTVGGAEDRDNPGWDALSEDFKDSNRQAADHIAVKLRAVGYHDEPLNKEKQLIQRFEAADLEVMAKMEHARWCAERRVAGWKHGPVTDRTNKISDSLLPWEQLGAEMQKRDREQIEAIPGVLAKIGRGIYR
jgi:hypothetical protein